MLPTTGLQTRASTLTATLDQADAEKHTKAVVELAQDTSYGKEHSRTCRNECHKSYLLALRPTPLDTPPASLNGQSYCSELLHNRNKCERIDPLTYLESEIKESE